MDYKGFIYAIKSHQTDLVYIGSTTQTIEKRLSKHKSSYKRYIDGKYNFVSSFDIIKFEDCYIELIEEFEYQNRLELTKREGELIKQNNCVNKKVEGRTKKEHYQDNIEKFKEYREDNKEKNKEYNKEYYQDNKEKIREQRKEYLKEYYEQNKEKRKEYQREYRAKKN